MTIQLTDQGDIEIRSQSASFFCLTKQANNLKIDGPGEYEVGDLAITVPHPGIYQITAGGIGLVYFERSVPTDRSQTLDELRENDLVIFKLSPVDLPVQEAQKLIQAIEPKVIMPADDQLRDSFCRLVGECPKPVKSFKITKSQLIADENQRIVTLS